MHRFVTLSFLCVMSCSLLCAQTTYYVSTTGSDGNSGQGGWINAFASISNAVAHAADGDAVLVSNGVYDVTEIISVGSGITIAGVNGASNTTIRAMPPSSEWTAGNTQILAVSNANAVVEGFLITGSYQNYTSRGAVRITGGTLRHCILADNHVGGAGGIYMTDGFVWDCIITNNHAYWSGNGGGVWMSGGVVSNCVVAGNDGAYNYGGGGVYITGGSMLGCTITNNSLERGPGAGVYMNGGGQLVNCLIARNRQISATLNTGGGVYMTGGSIINCTVADNTVASGSAGSGLYMTGGSATNCVFYYNSTAYPANGQENVYQTGGSIVYSCAQPAPGGEGNTGGNPDFVSRATGNYRLNFGSPCIDAGSNTTWVATDLDGASRPQDGDGNGSAITDMGCYEAAPVSAFACAFSGHPTLGTNSLEVVFTAVVAGPGTNSVTYVWDTNNDGVPDYAGPQYRVLTNTYPQPGMYSIVLTCTNALNDRAVKTNLDYVIVGSTSAYVVPSGGSPAWPYATWDTAATSIQDAVNAVLAPGTVYVTNGTYDVYSVISVGGPVTVIGVNGASNTTARARPAGAEFGVYNTQLFSLTHPDAVVEGFLLTGCYRDYQSAGAVSIGNGTLRRCIVAGNHVGNCGGVRMANGRVWDCIITNNHAWWSGYGGGVWMDGGTVSNCLIAGNGGGGYGYNYGGGGLRITAGTVVNCTVTSNVCPQGPGGGVYQQGGELVNCLVARNTTASHEGGGVYMTAGSMVNCTIADNRRNSGYDGSGLYMSGGVVTNTISYYNSTNFPATGSENLTNSAGTVVYSCMQPLPAGDGNIDGAPGFIARPGNNYRLAPDSPCINTGTNLPWMTGATDLDGAERVIGSGPDMGAYESGFLRATMIMIR